MLRRLLHDHEEFRGEVIFTFDGDEAGQKAAMRAFSGDQNFVPQTYVAVQPDGLDPCDLRLKGGAGRCVIWWRGESAVPVRAQQRDLQVHDLDRADGRIDAVRESAKLVASIRDQSKVTAFAQEISRMVGADIDTNQVLDEVRKAARRGSRDHAVQQCRSSPSVPPYPTCATRGSRWSERL